MSGLTEPRAGVADRIWRSVTPGQWLYAILDAARDPVILEKLCLFRPEFESLYRGRADQTMWDVAPYLVRLELDSEFSEWLFREGWGKHWGIWGVSNADLTQVHRHFRRFLEMPSSGQESPEHRYYDPQVLRLHLPSCDAIEAAVIFGPMVAFFAEGDDPGALIRFRPGPNGVRMEQLEIEPPANLRDCPAGETFQMASDTVFDNRAPRIRRATLIKQAGIAEFSKIWLRPGQTISIGRTDQADFAVPQDNQMNDSHFALECSWTVCRLRDLGSGDGTYVNGARVTAVVLREGDEIVAGRTTFVVQIERDSATVPPADVCRTGTIIPVASTPPDPNPPKAIRALTAKLEITRGPYDGRVVELQPNVPITIGRRPELDLPLEQDPSISRVHCRVEFTPPECRITDLGSSYGTHVNGQRVTESQLRDCDQVKIGNSGFRVRIEPLA